MSRINTYLGTFTQTSKLWSGAVGLDASTINPVSGLCARALIVATVVAGGTLVVLEAGGTSRTYTAEDITAAAGFLRGNFEGLVAAGSANCYDITVGW